MNQSCESIKNALADLQWSIPERRRAQRVLDHLQSCEACRAAADDYAALCAALTPPSAPAEPNGGWQAFENRLLAKSRHKTRAFWKPAVAAGLLIAFTALNGWLFLNSHPGMEMSTREATESFHFVLPNVPSDIPQTSVIKAFDTVSQVFDGRANWVMLSDNASDMGLVNEKTPAKDLLLLRVVLMRGNKPVSQIHLAVVPGATVRVTVPSALGPDLQYVIATDAVNLQNVSVSLAVENDTAAPDSGLGSMSTSLRIPFGKPTPTGRIATRDGTFDLSLTLEKAPQSGTKT